MTVSKIGICNIALAHLGAAAIRSFNESNKRSRMSDIFFESTRDQLLTKFDWPFARTSKLLNQEITDKIYVPDGQYVFRQPSDCLAPRDIEPEGQSAWWKKSQDFILAKKESIVLIYTFSVKNTALFTSTFASLLALGLAVKMAPVISQDKKLTKDLAEQYAAEQYESWEADANMGSEYRRFDEDPDNDPFVYPGGRWTGYDKIIEEAR